MLTGRQRTFVLVGLASLACVDLRPPPLTDGSPAVEPGPTEDDLDERGVGWVVRDGVLSSYVDRVRIEPKRGWTLLTDDAMARSMPSAGVGLYHPDDLVGIALVYAPYAGASAQEHRRRRMQELWTNFAVDERGPSLAATLANGDVVELETGFGDDPREFVGEVRALDHGGLAILAWYPREGDRERLRERVREGLTMVDLLPPAEIDHLRSSLADRPDRQSAVGPGWSLRGGVYRDFAHDLRWELPGPTWNLHTGPVAAAFGPNFALVGHSRDAGLVAFLSVDDRPELAAVSAEGWHAGLAEVIRAKQLEPVGDPRRVAIGGAEAIVQRVVETHDGGRNLVDYASIKHGSLGLWWIVGGPEALVREDDSVLTAVVAATRVDAGLEEIHVEAERVADQRWGYAIQVPPGAERKALAIHDHMEAVSWIGASASVTLILFDWSGLRRDEVSIEALEEAATGPTTAEFVARRVSTVELAGQQVRRSSWITSDGVHCDLATVIRDRTLYQLMVMANDPAVFERARAGFSLFE